MARGGTRPAAENSSAPAAAEQIQCTMRHEKPLCCGPYTILDRCSCSSSSSWSLRELDTRPAGAAAISCSEQATNTTSTTGLNAIEAMSLAKDQHLITAAGSLSEVPHFRVFFSRLAILLTEHYLPPASICHLRLLSLEYLCFANG